MMKNIFLLLFVSVLFLTGCTTTNPDGTKLTPNQVVENSLPYITPGVTLAATIVLEQALSVEDRAEKAKMIYRTASIINSLTAGTLPTPDELQKALLDYLPENKTHWIKYTITLKDIYAVQFSKLDGNTKLGIKVLNAIAQGCRTATESYLK